jgi:hypothetical protein
MRLRNMVLLMTCSFMSVTVASCKVGGHTQSDVLERREANPGDELPVGKAGDVCAVGGQRANAGIDVTAHACGAKLSCCYPCGIDGCDSVCATNQECQSWRTLP